MKRHRKHWCHHLESCFIIPVRRHGKVNVIEGTTTGATWHHLLGGSGEHASRENNFLFKIGCTLLHQGGTLVYLMACKVLRILSNFTSIHPVSQLCEYVGMVLKVAHLQQVNLCILIQENLQHANKKVCMQCCLSKEVEGVNAVAFLLLQILSLSSFHAHSSYFSSFSLFHLDALWWGMGGCGVPPVQLSGGGGLDTLYALSHTYEGFTVGMRQKRLSWSHGPKIPQNKHVIHASIQKISPS